MSLTDSSQKGGSYSPQDFQLAADLATEVSFEKSANALITKVQLEEKLIEFASRLLGSIFGLMGLIIFVMSVYEGNEEWGKR